MVGYIGTEITPICCKARSIKFHSGRFSEMMATFSPGRIPLAKKPKLNSSIMLCASLEE